MSLEYVGVSRAPTDGFIQLLAPLRREHLEIFMGTRAGEDQTTEEYDRFVSQLGGPDADAEGFTAPPVATLTDDATVFEDGWSCVSWPPRRKRSEERETEREKRERGKRECV
jgi:hypothetical protein